MKSTYNPKTYSPERGKYGEESEIKFENFLKECFPKEKYPNVKVISKPHGLKGPDIFLLINNKTIVFEIERKFKWKKGSFPYNNVFFLERRSLSENGYQVVFNDINENFIIHSHEIVKKYDLKTEQSTKEVGTYYEYRNIPVSECKEFSVNDIERFRDFVYNVCVSKTSLKGNKMTDQERLNNIKENADLIGVWVNLVDLLEKEEKLNKDLTPAVNYLIKKYNLNKLQIKELNSIITKLDAKKHKQHQWSPVSFADDMITSINVLKNHKHSFGNFRTKNKITKKKDSIFTIACLKQFFILNGVDAVVYFIKSKELPNDSELIPPKPVEAKPVEAKPVEAKPVEAKPVEAEALVEPLILVEESDSGMCIKGDFFGFSIEIKNVRIENLDLVLDSIVKRYKKESFSNECQTTI